MPARPATPCPRCDYDLSGARDSWTDSCPLEGRCPECGLDFRWALLLNADLRGPPWSFEHSGSRLVRRWCATAARSASPRRLWTELRVENPVVARRLALFVLGVCLTVHLLAACSGAIMTHRQSLDTWWLSTAPNPQGPYKIIRHAPRVYDFVPGFVWPYGWPGFGVDGDGLDWFERHRVVRPPGVFGSINYPASWIALLVLCAVLTPLSLVCAPDTLRGCRVRPAHLLRPWAYAFPSIAVVAFAMYCLESLSPRNGNWLAGLTGSSWPWRAESVAHQVCSILPLLWLAWYAGWWRCAVGRYLRLPQPDLSSAGTLAMGSFSSLVIAVYWPGSRLIEHCGDLLHGLRIQ